MPVDWAACPVLRIIVQPVRPVRDEAFRKKIRELARSRVRYGYKRIHVLLKREGIHVNHKRVHRLYCLEGLQIKAKRPRRHVSASHRQPPRIRASAPDVAWSMDFVSDQTESGKRFRALTVVDVFTRECLAIEPGQKAGSCRGGKHADSDSRQRRSPRRIYCDNGSEFAGRLVDSGLTATKLHWSSVGLESLRIMRLLNHSTDHCGMNA